MNTRINETSVQFLKGVGPARKRLFENLGVDSIEDLFYLFPRRYEDRTKFVSLAEVKVGEAQVVAGKVVGRTSRKSWYTRKHLSEMVIDDGTGRLTGVWFNQPYLENYFRPGRQVILYGKVDVYKNRLQMVAPEYEIIDNEEDKHLSMGRIVPIYPLTRGMTQRYLRRVLRGALDKHLDGLVDILPVGLRNKHHLANIRRSIENIHFPKDEECQTQALWRVSFEEFFLFQLAVLRRRMKITRKTGNMHKISRKEVALFCGSFPFELTAAQKRVINEIAGDMQKASPMLRLLQGDVGSGKTVVALFGCVMAYHNKKQSAILAPTEILARQHYENINKMLGGDKGIRGVGEKDKKTAERKGRREGERTATAQGPKVALLTSQIPKKDRDRILADILVGKVDIVIGTHALLGEQVRFKNLSFAVIDEQHKFGVKQRALLSAKGVNPDVLVMTATPIPRTLCITLFGDLDVSVLDEMPRGRGKVKTALFGREQQGEAYKRVRELVKQGQQAYIVFPIIEESETLDLKAAQTSFAHFKKHEFQGLELGLVHGQMKRTEADAIMADFKSRKLDILVATTVLEVGVDVANANVMVIENAERFGLAQLHQLRGRIGRGRDDGVCLLISDPSTADAIARIKAILSTRDGFKIAEQDLLIRGPGHYFGRHQHGLNELKFANPATQIDILELAREEAKDILYEDPDMEQAAHVTLREVIQERYPGYLKMVEAG